GSRSRNVPSPELIATASLATQGAAKLNPGNRCCQMTEPSYGERAAATNSVVVASLESTYNRSPSVAMGPPSGPIVGPKRVSSSAGTCVTGVDHSCCLLTRSQA